MVGVGGRRAAALGDLAVLPDEVVVDIFDRLGSRDVARLSCVSSVFCVLCTEEPLWMRICLEETEGHVVFRGSWRKTALERLCGTSVAGAINAHRLRVEDFTSDFLYRRWYRCHVNLAGFMPLAEGVERCSTSGMNADAFAAAYDLKQVPVMLTDVAEGWPARTEWTIDKLAANNPDAVFKVSQANGRKVTMRMADYCDYVQTQADEEPLYIFDSRFGEAVPQLLADYSVPRVFTEDLFCVLGKRRPAYRWLVIGPAHSGAGWHVDPAMTSAWNTLLKGTKRWALYPPGHIPPAVTVQVDADGDTDIDVPNSLTWFLEVYPLLRPEDRPTEVVQHPGETIFVPHGWWHCVLNLDLTIAVTQNFVSSANFEAVCQDLAYATSDQKMQSLQAGLDARKQRTVHANGTNGHAEDEDGMHEEEPESTMHIRPAYEPVSLTPSGGSVDYLHARDLRRWLRALWPTRPDLQPRIWQCARLCLNMDTWVGRLDEVRKRHSELGLKKQEGEELLPVGSGENYVFLVGDHAVKFYSHKVDDHAKSLADWSRESNVLNALPQVKPKLAALAPSLLASGELEVEEAVLDQFIDTNKPAMTPQSPVRYIITAKCQGACLEDVYDSLSDINKVQLAQTLGETLRLLHSIPVDSIKWDPDASYALVPCGHDDSEEGEGEAVSARPAYDLPDNCMPLEWRGFVSFLRAQREQLACRTDYWERILPSELVKEIPTYLPPDPATLLNLSSPPVWLHADATDQNLLMCQQDGEDGGGGQWVMKHLIDFGDACLGHALYDLVAIHLSALRADSRLLQVFLQAYELHSAGQVKLVDQLLSYVAMCLTLLHAQDAFSSLFVLRPELREAGSLRDVELAVWGPLNGST
eukprot:jgi/Chlat1/4894/Chrsp31S04908